MARKRDGQWRAARWLSELEAALARWQGQLSAALAAQRPRRLGSSGPLGLAAAGPGQPGASCSAPRRELRAASLQSEERQGGSAPWQRCAAREPLLCAGSERAAPPVAREQRAGEPGAGATAPPLLAPGALRGQVARSRSPRWGGALWSQSGSSRPQLKKAALQQRGPRLEAGFKLSSLGQAPRAKSRPSRRQAACAEPSSASVAAPG